MTKKKRHYKAPERRHSETLTLKITPAMKAAVQASTGITTDGVSGWIRDAIAEKLQRDAARLELPPASGGAG